MNLDTWDKTNGRIERQAHPQPTINAFKHGLAAIRSAARKSSLPSKLKTSGQKFGQWEVLDSFSGSNSVQSLEKIGGADGSRTHGVTRTKKESSFCGAGGSSAFEIGGIGEPLT